MSARRSELQGVIDALVAERTQIDATIARLEAARAQKPSRKSRAMKKPADEKGGQ